MIRDPIDFAAVDSFTVSGRGLVFTGPSPRAMSRERPEITGQVVRVGDSLYRVKGVERFLPGDPVIHPGEMIGLLVEGVLS